MLDINQYMYIIISDPVDIKDSMMSNYERFDNDLAPSRSVLNEVAIKTAEENLGDVHIQVSQDPEQSQSQITFHDIEDKQNGMDYIDDPAGNPFEPKTALEFWQYKVRNIVEHILFRAVTVLLILLDFILVIIVLASDNCADSNNVLEIISHIIITLFVLEIAARIFYQGKEFFYNCFDLIDMVIVVVSFIVDMVFIGIEANQPCSEQGANYAKLVVIGRVFRIIRIVRIIYFIIVQHRQVTKATRHVVSQNKRRYQKDGFDLDLCYITERVIAMSFPSKGVMALYRNPIREVARFFDAKHKDHYKLYNLCSERDYDETLFHNRVERVFIDDHNVPRLRDMIKFADSVRLWMSADKRNVIAIHCKGGKGRTGTMICCWLVDSGLFEEAKESLNYFGDRRTDLSVGSTFQGVETPSQSRYVGYYEKMKNEHNRELPPNKKLRIKTVKIEGLNGVGNGDGSDLGMEIRPEGNLIWECQFGPNINCQTMKYSDNNSIVVELQNSPVIEGDIKIMFRSNNKLVPLGYDKCPFYFWFYTSFIEDHKLILPRDEIDNPHKKKVQKIFKENFAIELTFEDVNEEL
ncbi:hypothetical protein SNE40_016284 [Patella caerulea]|uniref:Phosphatidylinositol-3,4,5-trisphosphate 3-phosphatase n=1 Tax=Patella caerulea TaxID=87958 RepID=A0AAN8J8Z6_PATCE